jgi:hypothetical protein
MFLFCCFVLPNGQEKPELKTSLFISYDGVSSFCSVVLFYQMVKRNLSLWHRFFIIWWRLMFLFCCFVLPNGQEKPKLMTSLFISYDGVWGFCSVVLFYQMVKRNLSLRHRFLYHMMASNVFVMLSCFTIMINCTVMFSFILIVSILEFLFGTPWNSAFVFWLFGNLLRELSLLLLLQLLGIIDLLQQFEDCVKGIALRKRQKHYFDKKIGLKIFTKWEWI